MKDKRLGVMVVDDDQSVRELLDTILKEKRERDYLRGELEQLSGPNLVIGRSTVMHQIEEMIRKIATLPTTVLLLGETGTGKKLMARHLHQVSQLNDRPFVT